MTKIILLIGVLILCPKLSAQPDEKLDLSAPHDSFWNGFSEGCIGRDIYYDIFWFDYDANLSYKSFLVGIKPDSNNGPSFIARLDTGISSQAFHTAKNNPSTVFFAWSLPYATCIVKTDFNHCPQANKAYNDLKKLKISLDEDFDRMPGRFVSHYTSYNLQQMDGSGQHNDWEVTSGDTDMQKIIHSVAQTTLECSQKAVDQLFERLKINKNNDHFKSHHKRFNLKPVKLNQSKK